MRLLNKVKLVAAAIPNLSPMVFLDTYSINNTSL
ncbi:MAG: hypothetical protein ACI80E_001432, partial [Oceanospirillaceae bacterium]